MTVLKFVYHSERRISSRFKLFIQLKIFFERYFQIDVGRFDSMTCQTRNNRTQRKLPSVILFQRFCYGSKRNQFLYLQQLSESEEKKSKETLDRSEISYFLCVKIRNNEYCRHFNIVFLVQSRISEEYTFFDAGWNIGKKTFIAEKDKNESFSFIVLETASAFSPKFEATKKHFLYAITAFVVKPIVFSTQTTSQLQFFS